MKLFLSLVLAIIYPSFALGLDNLTQVEAIERQKQIGEVAYDLQFEFFRGKNEYRGKTTILAKVLNLKKSLRIDSYVKDIKLVKVNGVVTKDYLNEQGYIILPSKILTENIKIEISYHQQFSGMAFKRFVDVDGAEYHYSKLEPYMAHHVFPCFDQPDLKAVFRVKVKAPKEWKVIGNELTSKSLTVGNDNIVTLNPTAKISTYLFFIGVGDYQEWVDKYQELPLRIFARKALASYVDVENIMEITKQGLKFFNEYFDYPHPFSNYGHVFVPDFTSSGMEQPGAVTMTENFIFRGVPIAASLKKREEVIYHEMAHMWFGNLVTMKWWNDLWLNESFATYMAILAQERASKNTDVWPYFHYLKMWGYNQDQYSTSHPIESEVPDTLASTASFDGITYAKGAASLKQLHYLVGEEAFKSGLRDYFKNFAFKNTIRNDFINSIAKFTKSDLKAWSFKWFETSGANRVRVSHGCEEGKIKNFSILQDKSNSQNLSPHKTMFGFYKLNQGSLSLLASKEFFYEKQETKFSEMIGKECPDFILPNYNDHDYALFELDDTSIKNLKYAISFLPESLSRLSLWTTLEQMVKDKRITPAEFMDIALIAIQRESNEDLLEIMQGLFKSSSSAFKNIYFSYLTIDERAKYGPQFESILYNKFLKAPESSGIKRTYFNFYLLVAKSKISLKRIHGHLISEKIPGISLDQDLRWDILFALSLGHHPEAPKLVEEELKRDPSNLGARRVFAIKAAYPELEFKKFAWEQMFKLFGTPYMSLREAALHMHLPDYPELSAPFIDKYFEKISTLEWAHNEGFVELYFTNLYPHKLCSEKDLILSKEKFSQAKNLSSYAKKRWTEAQDILQQCVDARKK